MAPNGEQSEVTIYSLNYCRPPKIQRGFFMPGSRIEVFITLSASILKENLHVNQGASITKKSHAWLVEIALFLEAVAFFCHPA